MIIALAGRRIDAPEASVPRFPLGNVPLVEQRLAQLFEDVSATMLVSSAACGADLVALGAARGRGLRRHVILPFGRDTFRATSVTDRPGDWGSLYDRVLAEIDRDGEVATLGGQGEGAAAYLAANHAILQRALTRSRQSGTEAMAVLVWEGSSRGDDDATAAFGDEARMLGLPVVTVGTL